MKWKSGATDESPGDKAWHFDFSPVTEIGRYYILDVENNVRSFEFEISPIVYNEVLKQAMRMFFYQRAGCAKEARYAGARLGRRGKPYWPAAGQELPAVQRQEQPGYGAEPDRAAGMMPVT